MHYPLEFGIALSGKIRRYYRSRAVDLDAGEVWFCGSWERHGWEFLEPPSYSVVLHILPPTLLNASTEWAGEVNWMAPFRAPVESRPQTTEGTRDHVIATGREMARRLLEDENSHQSTWLLLLLLEALLTLQRDWEAPVAEDPPSPAACGVVSQAVEMVFSTPHFLTAQSVATACGMNRSAFGRLFKGVTGISFAKFALRYRLSQTASQLLRTNDALKVIAQQWGFTDIGHLDRCFRRHYGCSPSSYRKQHILKRPRVPASDDPVQRALEPFQGVTAAVDG